MKFCFLDLSNYNLALSNAVGGVTLSLVSSKITIGPPSTGAGAGLLSPFPSSSHLTCSYERCGAGDEECRGMTGAGGI